MLQWLWQRGWQLSSGVLPEADSGNLPHLGLISCNVEAAFKPGLVYSLSPIRQLLMVITGCLSLCLNVGLTCVLLVFTACFNTLSIGSLQLGTLIICHRSRSVLTDYLHSLCLPSASMYWTSFPVTKPLTRISTSKQQHLLINSSVSLPLFPSLTLLSLYPRDSVLPTLEKPVLYAFPTSPVFPEKLPGALHIPLWT